LVNKNSRLISKFKKRKTTRTIIKKTGKIPDAVKKGLIVTIVGTNIEVEDENKDIYNCIVGGIVISNNENQSIVAVGDYVYFKFDENKKIGVIIKVEERRNHFSRKEIIYNREDVIAANIDLLIILISTTKPDYNKRLIDRFLVTAELNLVKPIICLNKCDLFNEKDLLIFEDDLNIYKKLNIPMYFMSAKYDIGLEELKSIFRNKISIMVGQSGSGKSTLLNKLIGKDIQLIDDVSAKTRKGKHTTSYVKMFDLPFGGRIIDTPGVREFGIWGLDKNDLALYFHEFDAYKEQCKFIHCSHIHEPQCAIKKTLEEGKLDYERYESYINIFESLK